MTDQTPLLTLTAKLVHHNAEQAAHSLESMTEDEAQTVLVELPPAAIARVCPHLSPGFAAHALKGLPGETAAHILAELDPQLATSILLQLQSSEQTALINALDPKSKLRLQELLVYPEGSAGRMMSTDFLSLRSDITVGDATAKIRAATHTRGAASYVYVIDPGDRLVGVVNMRSLIIASPDDLIANVMHTNVLAIDAFMDREQIAEVLAQRKYFAAPVIDSEGRLLGVIKTEQVVKQISVSVTEDLQTMFGVGRTERAFSPIRFSMIRRLPWLHVNLLTAFLAAAVVAIFEDVIARITILAVFLPVIAGQGGNAGAQSLAVVMRGLVLREIRSGAMRRLLIKEGVIGLLNGLIIGVVTGLVAWFWNDNPMFGLVVALAMIVNLIAAGLAGAGIPLLMKAVGIDPAQSSSIILTTVTDVVGFLAFLGFAVLFQGYLI
ncbi:MAG: magnesium transporter [candidate division Zixibacteria bacterium]|nr:magnesium transporter [candidate division Zixibacteria bacterium]